MVDTLTPIQRSERMGRVRSRDTKPELHLRRIVWSLGFHYRKNPTALIGRPDLAFFGRKQVIFLHGCFWHRHDCHSGRREPKSRVEFWQAKFDKNICRDRQVMDALLTQGWRVLTVWECELKEPDVVRDKVLEFMNA